MFKKILIANRGEISCRVINTAKRLGIKTVAVYSSADQNALHVKMADESIFIGPAASSESYLVIKKIIDAALKSGAEAIHPGYGFLSENAEFAKACADNELVFIGPPIQAIEAMGSKSAAKTIMENARVPLVPGYHGRDQSAEILKQTADTMGYPVLLKAVAGGGGKGMRQVWSSDEFENELEAAKRESLSSFGNDDMLVEKYLVAPRHVEFQVFCDSHGNAVHLFERDCTVQRRHQKVIEEAPAPNFSEELRQRMGDSAVRAARAINYQGAGTVEFLLDQDGSYYFMEMNTRLQVEHPVTEMISGQDLVEWQLRVASGGTLPLTQDQLAINGHAFEARIYAEDPSNDFLPTAGKLHGLRNPTLSSSVRIDTGVVEGDEVSPFYDPMISKLIVWAPNRDQALTKLISALSEYYISGITSNIAFLKTLASHPAFANAELDTGFIEKHKQDLFKQTELDKRSLVPLASLFLILNRRHSKSNYANPPWYSTEAWRLNQSNSQLLKLIIDGEPFSVQVVNNTPSEQYEILVGDRAYCVSGTLNQGELNACIDGHTQSITILDSEFGHTLFVDGQAISLMLDKADLGDASETSTDAHFKAPMNGTIVETLVASGDTVNQGDTLIVMEAMKMQHAIVAPSAGQVNEVFFTDGDLVDGGTELLNFTPAEAE